MTAGTVRSTLLAAIFTSAATRGTRAPALPPELATPDGTGKAEVGQGVGGEVAKLDGKGEERAGREQEG